MRSYNIYYKNSENKRVIVETFESENEDTAINKVDIYRNDVEFAKEHGSKIYWDYGDKILFLNDNGETEKGFSSSEELFESWEEEYKKKPFYYKIYIWFIRKWNEYDPWFNVKLGFERMFKGYDRRVSWNIDLAVWDLLRYAIPRYIDGMHGCPQDYCEKARKILNKMTDEEVKESYKKDPNSTSKEVEVAMSLYRSDLNELIENINVIQYYDNHGVQDINDKHRVDTYRFPIPRLKNSETIDYEKLSELREKKMDEVFEYLRKHISGMWD